MRAVCIASLIATCARLAVGCAGAGPGASDPAEQVDPGELAVSEARAVAGRCDELDDLREVSRAWARLCRHRDAAELALAQAELEACREARIAALVDVQGEPSLAGREDFFAALTNDPSGQVDLDFSLDFDNCPLAPPRDESALAVINARDYPVEDGLTTTVTFTNFCAHDIEYGFSPDDAGPPIIWPLKVRQRRAITLPRGYWLRARIAGTDEWPALECKAKPGGHLTFNADCETCTSGRDDPLSRGDCVAAGSCTP